MRNTASKIVGVAAISLVLASGAFAQNQAKLGASRQDFFTFGTWPSIITSCTAHKDDKEKYGNFRTQAADQCNDMIMVSNGTKDSFMLLPEGDGVLTYTFESNNGPFVEFQIYAQKYQADYDAFHDKLVAAYGQPTSEATQPFQNAYGATYTGRITTWLGKRIMIKLVETPGVDRSVTMTGYLVDYLEKQKKPAVVPGNPAALN